jgi:hypothetical protein
MTNSEEPSEAERRPGEPLFEPDETQAAVPVDAEATLRNDVVEREKERFGTPTKPRGIPARSR